VGQQPWFFHGGLANLDETPIIGRVTNWPEFLARQPWHPGSPTSAGLPTFWKSTFAYHRPAKMRQTISLIPNGLKAGHVWLNGHNLGECPQSNPMYLPECWFKEGDNDLVVFDLYGSSPDQLQLSQFEGFSVINPK
jgi:hypothetical protein